MYKNEDILNLAYQKETKVKDGNDEVTLTKFDLGELYLQTGKIVACDPFVCYQTEAFMISVAPGHYPVSISVAHYPNDDKRVALAMLKISDKQPVRWEMALLNEEEAERLSELEEDGFFGYGVDSGTGGFMDKVVADKIDETNMIIYDRFDDEFEASYVNTYSYLLCSVFDEKNKDLAMFSSGFGDGCYPCYFGFDSEDKPCCLVTDFCCITAKS